MKRALPSVGQLDDGLRLSPQRLREDKTLEVKRLFSREHVVHGPAQLMSEHGQRFGFAVFGFEFSEVRLPRLTLAEEKHGRFGKRPASVDIADLFARRAQPFAVRFFGALHQATVRHKILHARKAANVVDLI